MKRWIGAALLALALTPAARAGVPPVYAVVFTHIEDNTPAGTLGSVQSRNNYLGHRANLIAMAALAESLSVQWVLQPDWKILEAALLYEDASLRATTNGKNFLRHLKEDRGVVIDPHSHESGGYNYTDVAHLLDSLGVGATTVIGGHVWDPTFPQFQEWDRFRMPVPGERYPGALWRGDILMGSGTPNHVNDPVVSGVWRPRDRDHYFEDDPAGNIAAVGQWKRAVGTVAELIALYRDGTVPPTEMLTFSYHITPSMISTPQARAAVADTVIGPLRAWRDSGLVVITDFTSLIETWQTAYGGVASLYGAPVAGVADASVGPVLALAPIVPNPGRGSARIRYALPRAARVRLTVHDVAGRRVAILVDGEQSAGEHSVTWNVAGVPSGVYLCRLEQRGVERAAQRKWVVTR